MYSNRYSYTPNQSIATNSTIYVNNAILQQQQHANRTIYINENFRPAKVLVNPNFARNVHINPKFQQTNVYVNPSFLQPKPPAPASSSNSNAPISQTTVISTKTKLVRVPSKPSKRIINTKYKLVRNGSNEVKRRLITLTKHKLVRSSKVNDVKSPKLIKSRYKLVKNCGAEAVKKRPTRPSHIGSKYKLISKAYLMKLKPQQEIIKKALVKRAQIKYLRKNGTIYEWNMSANTLRIIKLSPSKKKKPDKLLVLKGVRYVLKNNNTYIKANKAMYRKNNIACMVYNKTGQCVRQQRGKCNKKHDPEQISICTWFLQGACRNAQCRLSHKVLPEKMPTCKFFLDGLCRNDACPYLHVKLSAKAPICKAFLEGYCANGIKCDKRHQLLCPQYEETGKCAKKDCRYPHGKAVRPFKDKLLIKIGRSAKLAAISPPTRTKSNSNTVNKSQKPAVSCISKQATVKEIVVADDSNKLQCSISKNDDDTSDLVRYYQSDLCEKQQQSNHDTAICIDDDNDDDESNANSETSFTSRPKIGYLPAFIPFNDDE